jgi:phosphoheptose isomerase
MEAVPTKEFLVAAAIAIDKIYPSAIDNMIMSLVEIKITGRLFILGNGSGAAHASQAVCGFRRLAGIEAYTFDNMPEVTTQMSTGLAADIYVEWLRNCDFDRSDTLFVLSTSGGSPRHDFNLLRAMQYVKEVYGKLLSITGPNGGYAWETSDICIRIPVPEQCPEQWFTPITEGVSSVVLSCLVNHLDLIR